MGSYLVSERATLCRMEKQSQARLFPAALFFLYKNRTPSKCPSTQTRPFAFSQNSACYDMQSVWPSASEQGRCCNSLSQEICWHAYSHCMLSFLWMRYEVHTNHLKGKFEKLLHGWTKNSTQHLVHRLAASATLKRSETAFLGTFEQDVGYPRISRRHQNHRKICHFLEE